MSFEEVFINWYQIKSIQFLFKFFNIILSLVLKGNLTLNADGRQLPNSQNVGQVQSVTVINKTVASAYITKVPL